MKKIKIFLAISDETLNNDKYEISNFIRDLNDKFEDDGIYIKLITDIDLDNIQEEIDNTELFIFILYNIVESKIIDEFKLAYKNFKEKNLPKIIIYVKRSKETENKSINDFIKFIENELEHYYNNYENVDTIKLNIIFSLQKFGLEREKLETNNNKLYLGSKEVMNLTEIPMIMNNNNLKLLKEEYAKLDNEYWKIKEKIKNNPNDDVLLEELSEINAKRKDKANIIFKLEKDILNLEKNFVELMAEGNVSKRQAEAKKYLNNGNIRKAKEILDFNIIKEEIENILKTREKRQNEIKVVVNEFIQRANILKLDLNNKKRFEEIEKTYEEAIRVQTEGNLERYALIEYAEYLREENKYNKAIEEINKYIENQNVRKKDINIKVYKLLADCLTMINKYIEARKYYEIVINKLQTMSSKDDQYKLDLSLAYKDEAMLDAKYDDNFDAYNTLLKSTKTIQGFAIENNDLYEKHLFDIYNASGDYRNITSPEKKEYYDSAIIAEKMYKKYPNKYKYELAISYYNLAKVNTRLYKDPEMDIGEKNKDVNLYYNNAIEYFDKAQKLCNELIKENPDKYSLFYGKLNNSYGEILSQSKNYKLAIEVYNQNIEYLEEKDSQEPEAYSYDLSNAYIQLAKVYKNIRKNNLAMDYFIKAYEGSKVLYSENQDIEDYKKLQLETSTELGNYLLYFNKHILLEKIYFKYIKSNNEDYESKIENYKMFLAKEYISRGIINNSEKELLKGIKSVKQLDNSKFQIQLINAYGIAERFYNKNNQFDIAKNYFDEALSIIDIDRNNDNQVLVDLYSKHLLKYYIDLKYNGKRKEAFEGLNKLIEFTKKNVNVKYDIIDLAYFAIAEIDKENGDYGLAISILKVALKKELEKEKVNNKNLIKIYNSLGEIYVLNKDLKNATTNFRLSIDYIKVDAEKPENKLEAKKLENAYKKLIEIYEKLDQKEKAKETRYNYIFDLFDTYYYNRNDFGDKWIKETNKLIELYEKDNEYEKLLAFYEKLINKYDDHYDNREVTQYYQNIFDLINNKFKEDCKELLAILLFKYVKRFEYTDNNIEEYIEKDIRILKKLYLDTADEKYEKMLLDVYEICWNLNYKDVTKQKSVINDKIEFYKKQDINNSKVIYNLAEGYLYLAMSGLEIPDELSSNFKTLDNDDINERIKLYEKAIDYCEKDNNDNSNIKELQNIIEEKLAIAFIINNKFDEGERLLNKAILYRKVNRGDNPLANYSRIKGDYYNLYQLYIAKKADKLKLVEVYENYVNIANAILKVSPKYATVVEKYYNTLIELYKNNNMINKIEKAESELKEIKKDYKLYFNS